MKKIIFSIINYLLRGFYRNEEFPYDIPFIRHPLYQNIRSIYYKYFSKYYDYEQKIKIKINRRVPFITKKQSDESLKVTN